MILVYLQNGQLHLTSRDLAAEQLQLECDSLVTSGWIYPHKAGLDRRDEVIPHLVQVVDVALKNLPQNEPKKWKPSFSSVAVV